jgi:predicted TIM-barrel fold metal-dependent hydrolase
MQKTRTVIDCHTHCFPESVQTNPREWAKARGEPHWANLVAPLDRPTIQDWSTPATMLRHMDQAGVQQAVLLGWYWQNESTCRWHNAEIAKWVAHAPDRFIGFATIYPNKNSFSQLHQAKELGLRGVGELHIGVQDLNVRSEGWVQLAEFCTQNNWPINLHVTEAAGKQPPHSVPTPLKEICDLAASAPQLKIILAHWGGGLHRVETDPKLQNILKNVYYDCSASPLLYDSTIFKQILQSVGLKKILFGSDYPLRSLPRIQKNADFTTYLNYIREQTKLTSSEFNALTRNNFLRLLK